MGCYIEEYEILGRHYGIEDYEDGRPAEEHFFGADRGDRPRFQLWAGGCGVGRADTLEEARSKIMNHARDEVARKQLEATKLLNTTNDVLARLTEPAHLFRFEAKKESTARRRRP